MGAGARQACIVSANVSGTLPGTEGNAGWTSTSGAPPSSPFGFLHGARLSHAVRHAWEVSAGGGWGGGRWVAWYTEAVGELASRNSSQAAL